MADGDSSLGAATPSLTDAEAADYSAGLFAAFHSRLVGRIRRSLPSIAATDAEELAAEVIVRRFVALRSGRTPLLLAPDQEWRWLQGIAQRVAWEHARSRSRFPVVDAEPSEQWIDTTAGQPDHLVDLRNSAAEAIAALPAPQREVISLRLQGLSIGEIADLTQADRARVSRLLYRARTGVGEQLDR